MPAYILVRLRVTDWSRFAAYVEATPAVVKQFGGRFLARGGRSVTLEGEEETSRVVILEFPTLEIARAFYDSEPYRRVIALREGAATAQFFAIEGVEDP